VRLADGGVQDNQGISALLDQGCGVLLASDASGQMNADDFPGNGMLSVPLRADSILQARVRGAEYRSGRVSADISAAISAAIFFLHCREKPIN
jgi:hypothetical protein